MRKIIAEIAVSVDGYIEGSKGELDWLVFDEEPAFVNNFLSRFEVIFYGRRAYERMGIYLAATAAPDSEIEYHDTFNHIRKYVFTRSRRHVPGNAMVINGSIRERVMQIKAEEGKDIWLCGGAEILSTFANLDLIDQYILSVQPVILGSGKPLFSGVRRRIPLELVHAECLTSGVVLLHYVPKD